MKLYKYLKKKNYLEDWRSGEFVFTKLADFLGKGEDHRLDYLEGSVPAKYPDSFNLQINGYETALSNYIIKEKPARILIPEKYSDKIFISSFSKKKNCEKLKLEFGQYVVEIDFNEELQKKFSKNGIGFVEVSYEDEADFSIWNPDKIWSEYAKELGGDNLCKLFRLKRKKYEYQEEFRFFFRIGALPSEVKIGRFLRIKIGEEWVDGNFLDDKQG